MKKERQSTYATNKGGKIAAPKNIAAGDPRVTKTVGDDLRITRKKG